MKLRQGFTLLELLIVIALIGVLAAFAFSALSSSKQRAMQVQCSSNLRQIGSAVVVFAGEHGGEFPKSAHTDEAESWIYSLSHYIQNMDIIRICPADPRAKERLAGKTTSYVLNEYVAVPLSRRWEM